MFKIEGDWEVLVIYKFEKLRLMFLKWIIFDIRVFFLNGIKFFILIWN